MEVNEDAPRLRTHSRRRFLHGMNTGVAMLLMLALALMVNYLSARHYYRADWSRSRFYELSDKTRGLLRDLKEPVEVTVLFQRHHPGYDDVDRLLQEYEYASPLIRVARVDPDRDLARAEDLARRNQVAEINIIIFEQAGRRRVVTARELSDVDYSEALSGGSPQRVAFKGEQVFSSALLAVSQSRVPKVYFLTGHGERDLESQERNGYSRIKQQMLRDNLSVRVLAPGDQSGIPDDADALVIAGPRGRYAESEVAQIRDYLARDGRLMVLLDSYNESGLEPLLESWGIAVGDQMVVDPSRTLSGSDLFVRSYGPHPITRNIRTQTCVFYLPRVVEPLSAWTNLQDRADKPTVVSLCQSSPDSWAESDRDQRPVRYDEGRDVPGPISLAAAAERGPIQGLDVTVRPARLVVVGDADFASNLPLTGANFDFFMSALNWLLERDSLMAIAPKPVEETRLLLDGAQLQMLYLILAMGVPGLAATLGVLVWMKRRV